ncbi:MAG TPA: hypothetical protein VGG74_05055 [Kofleriaceae bacterium]
MSAVALAIGLLASCGGASPPPASPEPAPVSNTAPVAQVPAPPPPAAHSKTDETLDKMSSFKDEMCTCKDSACAQRVADEMTKWAQAQVRDSEPPKMSDEQTQRATKLGEQMGTCMQTAMGASPQPTP